MAGCNIFSFPQYLEKQCSCLRGCCLPLGTSMFGFGKRERTPVIWWSGCAGSYPMGMLHMDIVRSVPSPGTMWVHNSRFLWYPCYRTHHNSKLTVLLRRQEIPWTGSSKHCWDGIGQLCAPSLQILVWTQPVSRGVSPVKQTPCSHHSSSSNFRDGFYSPGQVALGSGVGSGLGRAGFAAGFWSWSSFPARVLWWLLSRLWRKGIFFWKEKSIVACWE